MDLKVSYDGQRCLLVPESGMNIYNVFALKQALLEAIAEQQEVDVDLSCVNELDTAGLQLLILLKRHADAHGTTIRFTDHSQAVLDVLDLVGLTAKFGDPVVLTASTGSD